MKTLLPCYMGDYGRYISRHRAIPSYIDVLKPIERRLLLTLSEVGHKFTKSVNVIGHCMAKYHPHGDQSIYGTLENMVHLNFARGKGNWGSPGLRKDAKAAGMRYTQVRSAKWVLDLAFKYLNYVPWVELESDNPEPLYLPSPLPIGLIGSGVILGIAFHRTVIPRYNIKDLAKRLIWLIDRKSDNVGPIIKPISYDCKVIEKENGQFHNLLINGEGTITYIPHGRIDKKSIRIFGRSPLTSFTSLRENILQSDKKKSRLEVELKDLCGKTIDIEVIPEKKGVNLNQLATNIWVKYLNKNISFTNIICDYSDPEEPKIYQISIDKILTTNYHYWEDAILKKYLDDFEKLNDKLFEYNVILIIRQILEKNPNASNNISSICELYQKSYKSQLIEVEDYTESEKYIKRERSITDNAIKLICSKRSIQNLIENDMNIQYVRNEILRAKKKIDNVKNDCYHQLEGYAK